MNTILIIGSGRLAKHLLFWLQLNKKSEDKILTWDRHQDPHAIHEYILQSTHVWLAISDQAIVPFFEKYLQGHDVIAVHFSGALQDERILSAHPLMSFTQELYEESFYSKIYFALTGANQLSKALPGFANPFFVLDKNNKALYHALCVVAGNFPQMIWNEVLKLAEQKNIPKEAFDLYIQKIAINFIQFKEQALTGPFIRNDIQTIQRNNKALESTHLHEIYQTFQKEFLK